MRLTKHQKDRFVDGVMGDTPKIDYDALAKTLITNHIRSTLPEQVRALLGTPMEKYIKVERCVTPHGLSDIYVMGAAELTYTTHIAQEISAQLHAWAQAAIDQRKARQSLAIRVGAMIAPYTTLKAALKALPEFAKYLPSDSTPTATPDLPASNVVAELMAAGWPKQQQKK